MRLIMPFSTNKAVSRFLNKMSVTCFAQNTQRIKNHSTLHWHQCGRLVFYQFCVWWLYFAFMPLLTYDRHTLLALRTSQRSLLKYSLNDQTSSLPPPLVSLPANLWRSMTAVPQRKTTRALRCKWKENHLL